MNKKHKFRLKQRKYIFIRSLSARCPFLFQMARPKRVCVIVLGDLGRSPRMCNHAMSLAHEGYHVNLMGYPGSSVPSRLQSHANVTIKAMRPFPARWGRIFPQLLVFLLKVLWQSLVLLWTLPFLQPPDHILLQNPPTIPCLPVCLLYARVFGSKLVIDWHNYGHTILALSLPESHPVLRLSRWIEEFFGPMADAAFCVTDAMRKDLAMKGAAAVTLYDRAPDHLKPISLIEKHEFLRRLADIHPEFASDEEADGTAVTESFSGSRIELKEDRPGILVSSTSWTPDEDFSILFQALDEYEIACLHRTKAQPLPKLLCVITGKGPMKEYYRGKIEERNWSHIQVIMPWLELDDYPRMLASADLGVCLHTSSSGLDLPMKVVDMFGCGLPVCAIRFPALPELVLHDFNGLVFEDGPELAHQLQAWFEGFPSGNEARRERFQKNLEQFQSVRWPEYWQIHARPVFRALE